MVKAARLRVKFLGVHIWGIIAVVDILFKLIHFNTLLLAGVIKSVASRDTFLDFVVGAASLGSRARRFSRVNRFRPSGLWYSRLRVVHRIAKVVPSVFEVLLSQVGQRVEEEGAICMLF